MWTTILTSGLPLILKLFTWYLDWVKASDEQKESFLKFIEKMGHANESCMKLRDSYSAQMEAILEKRKVNKNKINKNGV